MNITHFMEDYHLTIVVKATLTDETWKFQKQKYIHMYYLQEKLEVKYMDYGKTYVDLTLNKER